MQEEGYRQHMRAASLTGAQQDVLTHVLRACGQPGQEVLSSALAETLGTEVRAVNLSVAALARRGLVQAEVVRGAERSVRPTWTGRQCGEELLEPRAPRAGADVAGR